METIAWKDFERVELRAGTIVRAEPFPEARKPAYKLWVDLGELGTKRLVSRDQPSPTKPSAALVIASGRLRAFG